jgi:serine/threonine protein kinase
MAATRSPAEQEAQDDTTGTQPLFGERAVAAGYVTSEQVEECLALQRKYEKAGKKVPKIGELLVHKKYIDKDQLAQLIADARPAKRAKTRKSSQTRVESTSDVTKPSTTPQSSDPPDDPSSTPVPIQPSTSEAKATRSRERIDLPPGTDYASEFTIEDRIEQRWLGDVFIARQASRDRPVMLTVIDPERMTDKSFKELLTENMKALAKLDHPNVQKLYAFGKSRGCYYLANEWARGELVSEKVKTRKAMEYPLAMKAFGELTDALCAIQSAGVLHGNIAANAISFSKESSLLLDAGIPFSASATAETWERMQACYQAPEVLAGNPATQASDVYSLAMVMYHLLAGTAAVRADTPTDALERIKAGFPSVRKYSSRVPQETADALASMTALDPSSRPASAADLKLLLLKLPQDIQTQVAVNYGAVLGQAAQPPTNPPTSVRAASSAGENQGSSRRIAAPTTTSGSSASTRRTAEKPVGPAQNASTSTRSMNYSELVAEMTRRVEKAEIESQKDGKSSQRTSLSALAMSGGRAYQAMESGQQQPLPPWVKKTAIGIVGFILVAGSGLFIWSYFEHQENLRLTRVREEERSKEAVAQSAIHSASIAAQEQQAAKRDDVRHQACDKAYHEALLALSKLAQPDRDKLEGVAKLLNDAIASGRTRPTWPGLADAKNLLARTYLYFAYAELAPNQSVKKDHCTNAALNFKEASRLYSAPEVGEVRFIFQPQRWMPEQAETWRYVAAFKQTRSALTGDIRYNSPADAAADMEYLAEAAKRLMTR